jgi:hypothetical protein
MDGHKDRFRYKKGEERYDICEKDNTMMAEERYNMYEKDNTMMAEMEV